MKEGNSSGFPVIIAIVVTYNGSQWVNKCFGSLVDSSIPLKVLAIDNGSSDNTVEIVRKNFPEIAIIETGKNLGFGKANNLGLKRAVEENADYIFLLNQDAWVENDTIEKLVDAERNNPVYGIISPIEYFRPGVLDIKFQKYYAPKELLENIEQKSTKIYKTSFVNAAAWLIPIKTIKLIGGFDSIFAHYGEDVDYCNRLFKHQFFVGIVSSAIYYHDRPQVLVKNSSKKKQLNHSLIKSILFLRWNHG